MGRLACFTLVAMLITGCSISGHTKAEPDVGSTEYSPPIASTSPPGTETRALVDLRTKVKGKILLHHVDREAKQTYWSAKLRLNSSYRIGVDCAGSQGTLLIKIDDGFYTARQCFAGYTTITIDNYPEKRAKTRKLTVNAPHGAKWAIIVAKLS